MQLKMVMTHQPVLCTELIRFLNPKKNQNFIDATVGMGGHALTILPMIAPLGKVLGIDRDEQAIKSLKNKNRRLIALRGNFKNLEQLTKQAGFSKVSGIYFDLGLGSWQIEKPEYGMSFMKDMPLLMQVSVPDSQKSAKEIVNKYSAKELNKILREYGGVRRAHQIAQKIVRFREKKPIESTFQLVEATGVKNPSVLAKIFQAFRIVVNQELENLRQALPQALKILSPGGRLVVISYHSGEDRIVKNFFRQQQRLGALNILTKKPITPSADEIRHNPRARSAKLRAAEKIK